MKYFNMFLVIVLLLSYNVILESQEIQSKVENSVLNKIIKSYEAGEIDYQTMMKYRIYALTNPDLLDQKFKPDKPIVEKCATTNVMEIKDYIEKNQKNGIPQDIINGVTGILARPTKQKFLVSPSGRFRIQYDTSGTHAVYQPTVDINPADGHPDYVNRCAEIFDYVYDVEITQMGYTPPPPDGTSGGGTNQYDVYLHAYSGAYGVTFTDGTVSNYGTPPRTAYKSYIYCDPTYTGFGYTDRTLPLKVTAAHEFFHAIQFAYNANAGNWFMEISSTWIEDIVYDNINDYRYYLSAFFSSPQVSLTKFDGSHEYASCIFGHYISENFGNDRIKRIWDYTVNAGSNIALNAIQNALVEIGTNRSDVMAGFTLWNYLTGSRANGSHPTYSEGAYFPQVAIATTNSSYPVSANAPSGLEFLGSFYHQFNSTSTPANLRLEFNQISSSSWRGKVVVDSASKFKSYDFDLSTGTGLFDLLSFNNKNNAVFIPTNVATSGTNLSYSYTANLRLLPKVLSPNGGEELYIDSTYAINWNSTGIDYLKIEYTTNNGASWFVINSNVPASTGTYSWKIPVTPTTQARVKISSTSDVNLFDVSDNVFKISYKPTITVLTPNNSEIYPIGFKKNIEWSSLNLSGNVKIEISRDSGNSYQVIFPNTSNDGIEEWLVTGPTSENARIKISSINDPSIYDVSDFNFYIRNANLTIVRPNGGEILRIDSQDTIRWLSNNMTGSVKILLTRDNGNTYETVFDSTSDDGEEIWNVFGVQTTNAKLKIIANGNNQVLDESDNTFSIFPRDFITVHSPLYQETWLIDNPYLVTWQSFGTSGNVKIELSRDGGSSFETLISNTPDDGTELLNVSSPYTHKAIIKISDLVNSELFGYSNEFIIGGMDTIDFESGWNLVSLKGYTGNRQKAQIFPAATSFAFKYNLGYTVVDTLNYGEGYWLKFNENGNSQIISAPRIEDTISVKSGWNLIGGLSIPVSITNIQTDPPNLISSLVYGYTKGYKILDSIQPGKAVWLKANQNGNLILSASNKKKSFIFNSVIPSEATVIEFIDENGNSQSLYLIEKVKLYTAIERYKLPPLPPSNAFDVRFRDDYVISTYDEQNNKFQIDLQGVNFPLKIRSKNDDLNLILFYEGNEEKISGSKELVIFQPISKLEIKIDPKVNLEIPNDYFLSQNYPNPFNPSTKITYGLPEDGFVVLKIFDLLGNEIKTLVSKYQKAGIYEAVFDAENILPNGVYYYQLKVNKSFITKKALLVK